MTERIGRARVTGRKAASLSASRAVAGGSNEVSVGCRDHLTPSVAAFVDAARGGSRLGAANSRD
jgi:hypothetical protein